MGDIWGVESVNAEVELLSAMVMFFKNIGLDSDMVGIRVNSRIVVADVLNDLGIPEDEFASVCVLVDKLEKMPLEAIQSDLEELGLSMTVIEKLTSILSTKSLDQLIPLLPKDSKAIPQLTKLFSLCDAYNISDWIVFDASIIRGLAYYSGIVFEAFDRKGTLRAIAGGGRYDTLLQTFGANDKLPAAGFGFGDAVIIELLSDYNLLPNFDKSNIDVLVYSMNDDLYPIAVNIAMKLRQQQQNNNMNLNVDIVLEPNKKTKWVFKTADRMKVNYVVIVAPDEYQRNEVSVKDLTSGLQTCVKIDQLLDWMSSSSSVDDDDDDKNSDDI